MTKNKVKSEKLSETIKRFKMLHDPALLKDMWFLRTESYFNLLQYDEFQDARQTSCVSIRMAIIALFISAFSIIYTVFNNP